MGEWAFVALGSNVGDRAAHLEAGRHKLATLPRTAVLAESTIEETVPIGPVKQGKFLNQMVLLDTEQAPTEILEAAQAAERETGRVREDRWGPRTLDVDIVRFGDRNIRRSDLTVPHPELARRPFWLREHTELLATVNQDGVPAWAQIKPSRQAHIQRVAALVETWAIAMGKSVDERARWTRAAFMHDAVRDAPTEELARWSDRRWDIPKLFHGPAAAMLAAEHGETDRGVLNAIRFHSLGYAGWDDAGRMLYMADYLEPGRTFKRKRSAKLAARVPQDSQGVLIHVVRKRFQWAIEQKRKILPEAAEFWNGVVPASS
ncbi:MAG: 2-amino-4-hydroxy-6-hydroxymethyldihydropteridine diphosphokinase [Gemmatimonadetes bacterium]|nr:2-amino-4-hydroxy-6-hydroxymethyldihydropteridine diphosphokinase [Gemmatimonadota bacterium]